MNPKRTHRVVTDLTDAEWKALEAHHEASGVPVTVILRKALALTVPGWPGNKAEGETNHGNPT